MGWATAAFFRTYSCCTSTSATRVRPKASVTVPVKISSRPPTAEAIRMGMGTVVMM